MTDRGEWFCADCGKALQAEKTTFSYLGHNFFAELLRCPCCGQVLIPEDLARGKIKEVETELEDK